VPSSAAGGRLPDHTHRTRIRKRLLIAAGLGAGWLALGVVAIVIVGRMLAAAAVQGLALLPRAIVWLAVALQQGVDWWSIAGRAGAALGGVVARSDVAMSLVALELVGAVALYGLQRLLRDEDEQHRRARSIKEES
jgi:hypothetical protein